MTDNDFEVVETGTLKTLDEKDIEIQRLKAALERLASPEAFVMSRATTAEEQARMEFAEKALRGDT